MNHTKSSIIDAFWQLLEERPYTKITVRDIVELCQVNRNTFYYHFHDIPELLETTIKSDVDQIIQTNGHFGSPTDCLIPIVERCLIRKKAMLHILDLCQYFRHKKLNFFSLLKLIRRERLLSYMSLIFNLLWSFIIQCTVPPSAVIPRLYIFKES